MLDALARMKYTQAVLESTKICFTLEAFKLVAKDQTVVVKADQTLTAIRSSAVTTGVDSKPLGKQAKAGSSSASSEKRDSRTEKREKVAAAAATTDHQRRRPEKAAGDQSKGRVNSLATDESDGEKPAAEITSYGQWRDQKDRQRQIQLEQDKLADEEQRKAYEKKKRDYERHRRELEKKSRDYERRLKAHESRKEKLTKAATLKEDDTDVKGADDNTSLVGDAEAELPEQEATGLESGGLEDVLPSMRIGYWLDKLASGVDQLSLLDKKVGQIENNVKKIQPEDNKSSTSRKTKDANAAKSVTAAGGENTKTSPPPSSINSDIFEDEIIMLASNLKKISVDEKPAASARTTTDSRSPRVEEAKDEPPALDMDELVRHQAVLDAPPDSHAPGVLLDTLKAMSRLEMSRAALVSTKIGLSVNRLRKSSAASAEVNEACRAILKSWKKLVPSSSQQSEEEKTSGGGKTTMTAQGNSVAGQKTPDEVRDYCRAKILSALKDNDSLADSCKVYAEELARKIEEEIFKLFDAPNTKYRAQVNDMCLKCSLLQNSSFLYARFFLKQPLLLLPPIIPTSNVNHKHAACFRMYNSFGSVKCVSV